MKIGELAAAVGLKPSAIRFYEASGLLPAGKRGLNGYRDYGPEALKRLQMIQLAQRLGFGLEQLRPLFAAGDDLPLDQVLAGIDTRRVEIAQLQSQLRAQDRELQRLRAECERQWAKGECVDLQAPLPDALPRKQTRRP
jgi:MerR family transcriptional regulator, copper efflux regulator